MICAKSVIIIDYVLNVGNCQGYPFKVSLNSLQRPISIVIEATNELSLGLSYSDFDKGFKRGFKCSSLLVLNGGYEGH